MILQLKIQNFPRQHRFNTKNKIQKNCKKEKPKGGPMEKSKKTKEGTGTLGKSKIFDFFHIGKHIGKQNPINSFIGFRRGRFSTGAVYKKIFV